MQPKVLVSVTDMKLHANDKEFFSVNDYNAERKRPFFRLSAGPLEKFTQCTEKAGGGSSRHGFWGGGGGERHSHIQAKRVCATVKGSFFKYFALG